MQNNENSKWPPFFKIKMWKKRKITYNLGKLYVFFFGLKSQKQ